MFQQIQLAVTVVNLKLKWPAAARASSFYFKAFTNMYWTGRNSSEPTIPVDGIHTVVLKFKTFDFALYAWQWNTFFWQSVNFAC